MKCRGNAAKQEQWQQLLQDWKNSKLSFKKWCRNHNVSENTARYWKSKLFAKEQKNTVLFTELSDERENGIRLEYQDFKISIDKDFDEAVFISCLRAMRKALC